MAKIKCTECARAILAKEIMGNGVISDSLQCRKGNSPNWLPKECKDYVPAETKHEQLELDI